MSVVQEYRDRNGRVTGYGTPDPWASFVARKTVYVRPEVGEVADTARMEAVLDAEPDNRLPYYQHPAPGELIMLPAREPVDDERATA